MSSRSDRQLDPIQHVTTEESTSRGRPQTEGSTDRSTRVDTDWSGSHEERVDFGPTDRPPALRDPAPLGRTDGDPSDADAHYREDGRSLAILSHMSLLFGLPIFVIPLVQRKNALALHHAKAAMVIYFAFCGTLLLSIYSTGLFIPLAMLLYLPGLVGIYRAIQRQKAGRWGLGDLAERLFPWPTAPGHPSDKTP